MDYSTLFKWFQPILNPKFSLIFGKFQIRYQIQKENGRIHAFLIGPKTFGIQNLELVKQCCEAAWKYNTFSISAIPNGNSMASDNLSVDPMAKWLYQTDINKSEEIPDNIEEGPKKSTLKKVDSFVSYTEPGPIVRHSSVPDT